MDMNKEKWEIKKLGEVGTIITGSTPKTSDNRNYNSDDYCFFKPSDFTNFITELEKSDYYISEYAYNNSRKLPINSVLVTCIGNIGNIAINKVECTTNQQINSIVPHSDINSKFLAYSIFAKKGYLQFIANAPVVPILNKSNFSNVTIPIPPLSTQEKIVSEFDTLHRLKELQEQQLAELDNLAQSTFYHLFGDPIENEKEWEVKAFKVGINEMFLGPFGSSLKNDCFVPIDKSYCMVYEQKHAIRKTLDVETRYIDKKKYDELKRFEVEAGDFLMSCRGTIGEIYRLPDNAKNGIIHPSLMKIRIKNNVFNPIFFETLLYKIVQQESVMGSGVKMAITAKSLGNKLIPIPPLSLQTHFSERIERIEAQKELIKQSISETQLLIDYTMDKYFG